MGLDDEQQALIKPFCLLTIKPACVCGQRRRRRFQQQPLPGPPDSRQQRKRPVVAVCAAIESEIADLDDADKQEFLDSLGLEEPGLNRLIRAGYELWACKPTSPPA